MEIFSWTLSPPWRVCIFLDGCINSFSRTYSFPGYLPFSILRRVVHRFRSQSETLIIISRLANRKIIYIYIYIYRWRIGSNFEFRSVMLRMHDTSLLFFLHVIERKWWCQIVMRLNYCNSKQKTNIFRDARMILANRK